jgi:hypothetical protein
MPQPVPPPLDQPAPPGAADAPAARRNAGPLLAALRQVLPAAGTVLEIGAGTGQHAAAFAAALAPLRWLPTDPDPGRLDSMARWASLVGDEAARPLAARILDAALQPAQWPLTTGDGVRALVATNVIHIAPWNVALGILAGAAHWLAPGDPLLLYGPFRRHGVLTGAGDAVFDASLRTQNQEWGIRDLDGGVVPAADAAGFILDAVFSMPANNLTVVLRRR